MRKLILSMVGVGLMSSAIAVDTKHNQQEVLFKNGQQIQMELSSADINRLSVKGDKIEKVICPQNFCDFTQAGGAGLLQLANRVPFTFYVTTKGGQNFSVLTMPKSIPGVTVQFESTGGSIKAKHFEKGMPYVQVMLEVIKDMMNYDATGKAPEGFGVSEIQDTKLAETKVDKFILYPVRTFSGSNIMGITYGIKNNTDKPQKVSPTAFYKKGMRASAIDQEIIPAGGIAYMYQIWTLGV